MNQPTFQIKIQDKSEKYSRLIIEPLEEGFGHTLGNSLRRVLLSHIRGAAVTGVEIKGLNHQFTTLEGMREDVVELVLNLKQLKVSYNGEEPIKATLKASGPGDVTAGQIELPSGVSVANPDLILAHLADKNNTL